MEMPEQLFLVRCGPQRTGPERMVTCPVCLTIVETFQDRRQADGRCRHLTHGLWLAGVEQSTGPAGSWVDLLRGCRRRVMRAPVLATGHGALGFWAALREAFPQTRQQRCWFHEMANVLAALPKSAHPAATRAMQDIFNAEDGDHARVAVKAFQIDLPWWIVAPTGRRGAVRSRSPRAPIPARPAWRWHSSSSRPPSPGDRP